MMSPPLMRIIRVIDAFSDRAGRLVSYLILVLIFCVSYEVFARYVLGTPTLWAYDLTYMTYAAHFMLGCAYTLLHGGHIRTDMLWEKFSNRRKGLIDAVAYLLFFFPTMVFFFVTSIDDAWRAWQLHELSEQTAWRPVLWPFKAVVPATALLLFIQGISEFIKSVHAARTGQLLTKVDSQLV
jgi:TRAP-type mannitol/chloroaromatic compound transport system permease small subunit